MNGNRNVTMMRLEVTMTEVEDIAPTIGDAARTSVEHCIITSARVLAVFVQRVDPRCIYS